MPGIHGSPDDPRAIGELLRNLQRRVATLETQVRLQSATIDAPGMLQYKDAAGIVRFALGEFDNGAIGTLLYDATGNEIAAAEQSYTSAAQTISSLTYVTGTPNVHVTATAGPAGQLLILMSALITQDAAGTGSGLMAVSATGGKVITPADGDALQYSDRSAAGAPIRMSRAILASDCDPETPTVVTAEYRVTTAQHYVFDDVRIQVIPL